MKRKSTCKCENVKISENDDMSDFGYPILNMILMAARDSIIKV